MNKENIIRTICLVVGFGLAMLFLRGCMSTPCPDNAFKDSQTVTIVHDTIEVFKTKELPAVKNIPVKVIPKSDVIDFLIADEPYVPTTRVYQDSTKDSNVVVIARDSIDGVRLGLKLSYRPLKPTVNTIITIRDSTKVLVPTPTWGIYASGGVGGNGSKIALNIGADFISAKKWGLGYHFEAVDRVHNVSFKWKVF